MLTPQQMLTAYNDMYDISCKMFHCAYANLWDEFLELEKQRNQILHYLQINKSLDLKLEGEDRVQLEAVCTLILEEDQKILPLMQQWMNQIAHTLQSTQVEGQIRKAYDANLGYE